MSVPLSLGILFEKRNFEIHKDVCYYEESVTPKSQIPCVLSPRKITRVTRHLYDLKVT